jgi:hypothetical protein
LNVLLDFFVSPKDICLDDVTKFATLRQSRFISMHSPGAGGFLALALFLFSHSVNALDLRVIDATTRTPMPGATVQWIAGNATNRVAVDGQGTVSISVSPNHDLRVIARKPGFAPMTMSWPRGKAPAQFELPLPPAQPVGGRIVTESGAPVAGANVVINVPRRLAGPFVNADDLGAKSDTNGSWRCEAVPATASYIEVEISHPDFALQINDASREKLAAAQAHCVMVPVVTLRGRVLDHEGRPVRGAEAAITTDPAMLGGGRGMLETTTDPRGEFQFPRLGLRRHLLGVKADGSAPALQFVDVTNNAPVVEVRLTRGSPLLLRVVDVASNAIAGASVSVDEWPSGLRSTRDNRPARWSYPGWEWNTDRDGRFVWPNAPTGSVAFTITKAGYMRRSLYRVDTSTNEHSVILGPTFSISGKVVDAATGKPIPEFAVDSRFAAVSVFNGKTNVPSGNWYDRNRKQFTGGAFALTFDSPLLHGSRTIHDWQFRVEADGYESALSRVIRDAERGTNIEFRLKPQTIPQIDVASPSDTNRVTAALVAHPKPARYGETITLFVKARVAPGCHIYALEDSGSKIMPTSLTNRPSHFFKPDGPWRGPQPKVKDDGSRTLSGDILFQRRYNIVDQGIGPMFGEKIAVDLTFQVCNEALCWPPETIHLETLINVLASQ